MAANDQQMEVTTEAEVGTQEVEAGTQEGTPGVSLGHGPGPQTDAPMAKAPMHEPPNMNAPRRVAVSPEVLGRLAMRLRTSMHFMPPEYLDVIVAKYINDVMEGIVAVPPEDMLVQEPAGGTTDGASASSSSGTPASMIAAAAIAAPNAPKKNASVKMGGAKAPLPELPPATADAPMPAAEAPEQVTMNAPVHAPPMQETPPVQAPKAQATPKRPAPTFEELSLIHI